MNRTTLCSMLGMLVLIGFAQGCASGPRARPERAVASLESVRGEMVAGLERVDQVLTTVGQLEARPAKLTPVYKRYVSQVNDLRSQAKRVADKVRDMRVRAAEYSAQWQRDTDQISHIDLRAASAERAERVRGRYDAVDAKAQEVRAAYEPFITELLDLEMFLANDLTYAGVTAAKPVFESVRARGATLKEKAAAMLEELDEAYTRLSPATTPAQ